MSQVSPGNTEDFIPYGQPLIGQEETEEVLDTLKSGWLSRGPKCTKFEEQFAEYVGCQHAVALNSCTSALFLALKAMGVGPGDEVITTPFTFAATANVVVHLGATPVFADIDPVTYNISPEELARKITPRTKVLLPVHYAGQACDMDAIMAIARSHGLRVVEDAAHAVHTTWGDQMVGSIGDAACFSFYVTKNLMTGEGGMLTTNDSELANTIRLLSLHGMDKDAWKRYSSAGSWFYQLHLAGYKCNMTDLQAGLGLSQLAKLPQMQAVREEYARAYTEGLEQVPGILAPQVHGRGR
ncbi:MAG TPA: DegT/DnrJ/EryC1/StrS aminotransferase family protein, partial [Bacillota bacterium]|nr:DegT/DnrJ/EryC1/StrS aminotransferase family protein [Bacillota bacterium]